MLDEVSSGKTSSLYTTTVCSYTIGFLHIDTCWHFLTTALTFRSQISTIFALSFGWPEKITLSCAVKHIEILPEVCIIESCSIFSCSDFSLAHIFHVMQSAAPPHLVCELFQHAEYKTCVFLLLKFSTTLSWSSCGSRCCLTCRWSKFWICLALVSWRILSVVLLHHMHASSQFHCSAFTSALVSRSSWRTLD